MRVAFCGHRQLEHRKSAAFQIIDFLESVKEPIEFFIGGYGMFDHTALEVCQYYKKNHPEALIHFVTPYLNENYLKNKNVQAYDDIICPDVIKRSDKYNIVLRNKWMVDNSDLLIACVTYNWGGAYTMLKYAERKGLPILYVKDLESRFE